MGEEGMVGGNGARPLSRLPAWVKKAPGPAKNIHEMKKILRARGLHTVCESAKCPNIGECFSKPTATFMILGDNCTRQCGFCAVGHSKPNAVEPLEAQNIALTCKDLALGHVVITSVTRDDLPDGGAAQFALTTREIRDTLSDIFIELLVPDFRGAFKPLKLVLDSGLDILNHNLETVPALYAKVRPGADYKRSLRLLQRSASAGLIVKTGIMLGFGECAKDVAGLFRDVASTGCSIMTIGQYLRPSRANLEVVQYVEPQTFNEYADIARDAGIKYVYSGPMVRSSYNAEEIWKNFTE